MIDKKKLILTIFSIVFVLGLLLVIKSGSIGEYFSRQYEYEGWSTNPDEVRLKTIAYMVTGSLVALVSGFGLTLTIVKTQL